MGGDEFDPARCNTFEAGLGKTTPVGAYPDGVSAYGCYDMAGNVWEWTESPWPKREEFRVVRGGSFGLDGDYAAPAFSMGAHAHFGEDGIGFRCART